MATLVVVLATLGCGVVPLDDWMGGSSGIEVTEADLGFGFATPTQVIVKSGDSLSKIAKRHDVTVGDLRTWNALETDVLEVDQVLFVWEEAPELGSVDVAAAGDPSGARPVARAAPAPKPAPSRSMWRAAQQAVFGTAEEVEAPPPATPPPEVGEPVQVAAVDQRRSLNVDRTLLKGSGILDADMGTDAGIDLARSASGMARRDSTVGEGGLGQRSLGNGDDGETLELADPQMRDYGAKIPDKPVSAPRLSRPGAKRCLAGPSATMNEKGMVTSNGLDVTQINTGMGRISRHTMRCFPRGTEGTYQVNVEVKVGCDGLVDNVYTIGAGAVPSHVTSCIEQTLGYASFAAHAVPDGVSFQYPLKFSF